MITCKNDRLLELLWFVGYCIEFPTQLAVRIGGGAEWNRRVMYRAIREGYVRLYRKKHKRHVIRSMSLTQKGFEYVAQRDPEAVSMIYSRVNSSERIYPGWIDKILRLHAIAIGTVMSNAAGATLLISQKPSLMSPAKRATNAVVPDPNKIYYYAAHELRVAIEEYSPESVSKSSRTIGIIVKGRCCFFLYFTGSTRMYWMKNSEENYAAAVKSLLLARGFGITSIHQIVIGSTMSVAQRLCHGAKPFGNKYFVVSTFFAQCLFLTNNKEGDTLLKLILHDELAMEINRAALSPFHPPRIPTREYDAIETSLDRPVLLNYQCDLLMLSDIHPMPEGFRGSPIMLCFDYQTQVSAGTIRIDDLTPGMTVIAREVRTKDGYILDDTPQSIKIKRNAVMTLEFRNQPNGGVLVKKVDAVTNAPISDVEFLVTDSDGNLIGNSNGKFVTDSAGTFTITDIAPGTTLIIKETRAKAGYILDDTPQTVKVKSNEVTTVEFRNQPKGNLIIVKQDSITKEPLEGVQFKIVYADGSYVDAEGGTLSSNGLYWTDKEGKITLSGISGTVVVTEVETIPGYTIDENTRTQTVVINPNDTQTLHFYNDPVGGVEIIKVNEDNHSERIPNTTFEIRKVDDALVDTVTTDKNGRVFVPLKDGSYYAKEVTSNKSFRLDDTPHYFEIKDGKHVTLQVTNKKLSGIVIHKIDSATGEGIYGVKFVLYDANKKPIGEYTSDDEGYIYIDEIPGGLSGRFYLRELEAAPGYTLDKQYKTVYVSPGKTVEIEWENTAVTGQIQIYKYAAEYNEVTGTAAGTPLKGAVYEIVNARSGKVVDYITTDARGVAASKPLPLTRYQLREVTSPAYWQLDPTVHDVTLEYPGQIIKLSAYDKPASLGVTITKRGNAQVMAGQSMRYDLTVANTSNVPLESFFWHDKIPYDVARPTTLTTGTYSARLNYRVLYKTNYNASYQVLASNLLTSNNYSFSLNAIPMQAGEVVTDIYFDFGKVPVGFQSVVNPTLSVMVNGNAVNGYQMVNRADVGGKYQGTWQTATASWVTIIRRLWNTPTLPKTGY